MEFFPVRQEGQEFILVRDQLGLSPEGTALGIPLYRFMTLLDGSRSIRDLQTVFMRQQGGVLVGSEEVVGLLKDLDTAYLLDSETFRSARDNIVSDFTNRRTRPTSHSGKSYPANPAELSAYLTEIMVAPPAPVSAESILPGTVRALVAPHIDINVGNKFYGQAYGTIANGTFTRVVVLGTGHRLQDGLFSLTDKDFETPLGLIQNDNEAVESLQGAGEGIVSENDFVHRSEHSIEFQLIFLQHVLKNKNFTLIPILCGSLQWGLSAYTREAFLKRTGSFLGALREVLMDPDHDTLLVAGVDFSHTGHKFGHDQNARAMENQFREHDQNLLRHLAQMDADHFWKESERVRDRYHVCGFSALACLLEVLPKCRGTVLGYDIWHEAPTRSAVSFASVVFTEDSPARGS